MKGPFTEKARRAIQNSQDAAVAMGQYYVGTEHILLGLAQTHDGIAAQALQNQGVSPEDIKARIEGATAQQSAPGAAPKDFTPRAKKILEMSQQEAMRMHTGYIGTEHLLIALLKEQEGAALRILADLSCNIQKLYDDMMHALGGHQQQPGHAHPGMPFPMNPNAMKQQGNQTPTLDRFSRDFTKMAQENKFDPIVGRTRETERVIQILTRRTKNNPCLVGDPGVGKTAIAEGLAQRIISGDVPEPVKDKRVVQLDLPGMVAGTKYRGEFEERIKRVVQEVTTSPNVILFIDELHTLIGAGGAEGALDAANILKPSLARGEMQVIGATTLDEYRKHIEKDAALERRFQPVMVDEPSEEEAIEILRGIRDKYEAHHSVKIGDDAIVAAVRLSARYVSDRFLPDKAIDLLDETCSKVRLRSYTAPPDVKALKEQITELDAEKEAAIKVEEFEKAGLLKQRQNELKKRLDLAQADWMAANTKSHHEVNEEEIADVLAAITGIPVKRLQEEEGSRLMEMEATLHKRIIGQNAAVTTVSKAIRRGRVGLKNPARPIGSFLFLGPTGVGKTYLCRALAEILFGDENAIIRVDMSEFMEKHTVSRLIGSPPGYVGYDEGGQFSEKVRRKPYSVVLFDEVEKAHPDVFNVLLQVLDEGHITDAQGRKINFKNTVIIMTSNAGARQIVSPKTLGFIQSDDKNRSYEDMKKRVMDEVKNLFRPEFINRIDDIIVFHPLGEEEVQQITRLMLNETVQRVKENMGITLHYTDALVEHIAKDGYDPLYGARPLRRAIQTQVEDELAEDILRGKFKEEDAITVDYMDEKVSLHGAP
ncbi:MAG: ATP-dependent Clp protease ATP-binding subunit [Defluviitaleaceae bacterium]|nr:ATP-dependent Clp protease ATP-binding subunit [Defluviitaleaceae bacterium]MCL2238671.1 ATP-dependent Clp protease ATP-binding subunit [Defluviitaleaceae bacterium]